MSNETIADIAAEIRDIPGDMYDGTISMFEGEFHSYADRIEEAWKREKAEIEASALAAGGMVEASRHKQGGNAAAMREALVLVKIKLADWGFTTRHDAPPSGSLSYDCARLMEVVNDALSAPSRNCDRLSADQCKKMFEHEMGIYLTKEATDRDREIARRTAYGVIDALYAERKGESDGK